MFGIDKSGNMNEIYEACTKHFDYVRVEPNDQKNYPYRLAIRCGKIHEQCLYELEAAGYAYRDGTTCNEWETSLQLKKYPENAIHPPHLAVDIKPPKLLKTVAPKWFRFLSQVKFLGELLGTLRERPIEKLDFGECTTSIVLETYQTIYGGHEYKTHQCDTCINMEIGFKNDIEAHNFESFQRGLENFCDHFEREHSKMIEEPKESSKKAKSDSSEESILTS